MAKMWTCNCGWTVISPQGEEDAKRHVRLHLQTIHPEVSITDAEISAKGMNV